MAETPSGPTLDPRLRAYLDTELRRAEDDFARLPLPTRRRSVPMATLIAAAALLVLVVVAGSQLLGRGNVGPAAVQLGPDGLPTAMGAEPVLRGDDISKRAATGGAFLAGGTLTLASDPCPMHSDAPSAPCTEQWALARTAGSGPSLALSGVAAAPGFVHTSGALTVVRVEAIPGASASASPCATCTAVLAVDAVVWRQPTKGAIPAAATPPQGGAIFDALVPDFVATLNQDQTGIAGYTPKRYLIGPFEPLAGSPSNPPQEPPEPVYAEDLTTLVGYEVAGVGFVPLGQTAPSATRWASVAPSASLATLPVIDCGRIAAAPCQQAIGIARGGHAVELESATLIVVDDVCAPGAACDRATPFDALVVFVTAGPDTASWVAFSVTGPNPAEPQAATPWTAALPAHIAQRVAELAPPSSTIAPASPSPLPSLLTSPPPGQSTRFDTASLSADGRTLTLDFIGGAAYAASDPCSVAYAGWAEASGDSLYAAVVDVTAQVRPPGAPTAQACDAVGHARTVTVTLAAPFTGARVVDLAGYVHFLRAPSGLVELTGLPAAWALRSQHDVEDSPTGRWLRIYAPLPNPPTDTSKGRLELYQSFGGPADVSGGEEVRTVTVNGQPATLYRSATDGELVLVWSLGGDGLAISANETDFPVDQLIRLAESATLP